MKFYASYTICHFHRCLRVTSIAQQSLIKSKLIVCQWTFRTWLTLGTVKMIISQREYTRDSAKGSTNVEVFTIQESRAKRHSSPTSLDSSRLETGSELSQMPSGSRGLTQFSRKINAIRLFFSRSPNSFVKIYEREKIALIAGQTLCYFQALFRSVFHFRKKR